MVTLRMLTVPCDANTSVNGMTCPIKSFAPHFYYPDLRNAVMSLASGGTDTGTNDIT